MLQPFHVKRGSGLEQYWPSFSSHPSWGQGVGHQ